MKTTRVKVVKNEFPRLAIEVPKKVEVVQDEVLDTMLEKTKDSLYPGHGVDTGEMKAGIHVEKEGKVGAVVNDAEQAQFVEFGTRNMSPIPHMAPGAEAGKRELNVKLPLVLRGP